MKRALLCALLLAVLSYSPVRAARCESRSNNTVAKLLECVTLDAVREHQAAFQMIADANGGIRASGTPGYDASVGYVAGQLEAAGYDVSLQLFPLTTWLQLGPSTLEQTSPGSMTYLESSDYALISQTDPGDVTALVSAVDLDLGLGNSSTSGCEVADFAGFPAGHIALIQRGGCLFRIKAENASSAGAVGAIVFNQGNAAGRLGLINGTLSSDYSGGIPVVFATYDRGVEWAGTPGLTLRLIANVFRGTATVANVLAETAGGRGDNVVMAGAHLDSITRGPGIQDNGAASAVLLETAVQMKNVRPSNAIRFAWWGAEESGLVGSTHYVNELTAEELDAIALYLNFDIIGSPNFVRFVYDGDGSDFGSPGPPGSGAIEALFNRFYDSRGLPHEPSNFGLSGRTDAATFAAAGIPVGGIFTGAEEIKTDEQAAIYGGTAGDQYDPCYHLACDTFDNVSLEVLEQNMHAAAAVILRLGASTEAVNGIRGRGPRRRFSPAESVVVPAE